MESLELFQRLSVALAIGLLMGLERGWKERAETEGGRSAGLRTFALSGLMGGVWGAIALGFGDGGALGLAFLAFAAVIAAYRLREVRRTGSYGATTIVAALLTFALGAYAMLGDMVVAAAAGVAATLLLALKAALHAWVQRLSWAELRAGLVLLAMTVILLPILPNRAYGPFAALNPYEIWLMTVLIAVVSSAGYVAIKAAGARRGVLLSALAGGLVSSTATTLSFGRLVRSHPERADLLAGGAAVAGATTLLRMTVIAGVFNPHLLTWLIPPMLIAAVVLAGAAAVLFRSSHGRGEAASPLELKNPFELGTVLKFGLLLAVILFLAKASAATVGETGVYALAAASGLADVDAITLSMARLDQAEVPVRSAAIAILLAGLANTTSRTVLFWLTGGRRSGVLFALSAAVAVGAGLVGFVFAGYWDPAALLDGLGADGPRAARP